MSNVTITILQHGPLLVSGGPSLKTAAGEDVDTGGRNNYALCRCGASSNKPFCDGSHSAVGFSDDPQ